MDFYIHNILPCQLCCYWHIDKSRLWENNVHENKSCHVYSTEISSLNTDIRHWIWYSNWFAVSHYSVYADIVMNSDDVTDFPSVKNCWWQVEVWNSIHFSLSHSPASLLNSRSSSSLSSWIWICSSGPRTSPCSFSPSSNVVVQFRWENWWKISWRKKIDWERSGETSVLWRILSAQ